MQLTVYISKKDEKHIEGIKAAAKKAEMGLGAYMVKLYKEVTNV